MRVSVAVSVGSGATGRNDCRPFPTNQGEIPGGGAFIANVPLMNDM